MKYFTRIQNYDLFIIKYYYNLKTRKKANKYIIILSLFQHSVKIITELVGACAVHFCRHDTSKTQTQTVR